MGVGVGETKAAHKGTHCLVLRIPESRSFAVSQSCISIVTVLPVPPSKTESLSPSARGVMRLPYALLGVVLQGLTLISGSSEVL